MTQIIESPESSSPIITGAVAAGLKGAFFNTYRLQHWQRFALNFLGLFPQSLARSSLSWFQTFTAHVPDSVSNFSIEESIKIRLADYDNLHRRFPAVTVGVALGGATAHLSLVLDSPFLPQAFVMTLKGGTFDGNVQTYFNTSHRLALRIAQQNPSIMTIQHFDPVHDGWLTRRVNQLRFKLLDLPKAYQDYLRQRLEPGGAVCFLDCSAQWLRFRVGERSVFQVGGWGDISPQEYLNSSQRLEKFCRESGLKPDWYLNGYDLEEGAESEWGTEPGLREALEAFCRQEGYRFVHILLPNPHDFSLLALRAMEELLRIEGKQPAGVLVEMFTQFDATAVMQSGLLPLWLIFNTRDSLSFLERMVPSFPPGKPVFFSPLSTFSVTPDLVPWKDWEVAFSGLEWRNIGARPSHYPADAKTLVSWSKPLRHWVAEHSNPIHARLTPETLKALANASML